MIIVVDAYNVLKKKHGSRFITAQEQTEFIAKLTKYSVVKKHTIIIVFDGGDFHWPASIKEGLVSVIYSGDRYTADEVIKKLVASLTSSNEEFLLVSSDRALCDYALNYKIYSLDPEKFNEHTLASVLSNKAVSDSITRSSRAPIKYIHEEEHEEGDARNGMAIDELMQKAAQVVWVKDKKITQENNQENKENNKKLPKREKQRERLIRKL